MTMQAHCRRSPVLKSISTAQTESKLSSQFDTLAKLHPGWEAITVSLKPCIIETKKQWNELCTTSKIDPSHHDEHATVFIDDKSISDLEVSPGSLINLALECSDLKRARFRTVIVQRNSYANEDCQLTYLLWFNLCQDLNHDKKDRKVLLQKKYVPDTSQFDRPSIPYALEVHICLINTHYYSTSMTLNDSLAKYFTLPRKLCVNDVIVIPRDSLPVDEYTINISAEAPVAYYKVILIMDSNNEIVNNHTTFIVSKGHSDLIQSPGSLSQCVPVYMEWFLSHNVPGKFWRRHPLPGLNVLHEQLVGVISPYLQTNIPKLPATILLMGTVGVGKFSLVRSVAIQLDLQLLKVNCHDLCGDSAAATEARIRNLFNKAQACTPSILLLENFDALGRDKDTYDIRVAATFAETVLKIRDRTSQALIIIASTPTLKLEKELSEVFLHEFIMQTPTESERKEILQGLLEDDNIENSVSENLAKHTAGMVLGDLTAFVSTAKFKNHERNVKESFGCHHSPDWLEEQCMSSSTVPALKSCDIDNALHHLQTRHADAIGAPKIPNVSWDDVGGLEDVKNELLDTIQLPLQHPELFDQDLRRSGILLYGPPGSGKTLLAKALAKECSLNFMSVKGPELINAYVGQSEENIREVFVRAQSASPCVVFFDELDSLAPYRGNTGDSGGVMDRVVSQLLAELDGLRGRTDVFVIAATNRPDLLDPALTRPGRFDKLLYLGVPDNSQFQLEILNALTRKFPLCESVDLADIAARCPLTLTGADLYALCADAMMSSIRRRIRAKESGDQSEQPGLVTMDDFNNSLSTLKPSVTDEDMARYRLMQQTQTRR